MSLPRMVFVIRRFWPLVGGPETMIGHLARRWCSQGGDATVLTMRWDANWPAGLTQQGVRIERLPHAGAGFWAERRYQRSLTRWLVAHRRQFDAVYVSQLAHDAFAVLAAADRGGFPVALRAEGSGLSGDCHWQLDARFGRRIKHRCFRAAAVIAPSAGIQRELIAAGYPRDRIRLIHNGVPTAARRNAESRTAARSLLANADPTMTLPPEAPLVVFAGRLRPAKALDCLLRAWPAVVGSHPAARLWLVGEGPDRKSLADLANDLELAGSVTFGGTFDDTEEIWQAADLFVLPSVEEGLSMALLEAMAAELAIVATDVPGNNEAIEHGRHGLLVPPQDADALGRAIVELMDDSSSAAELGRQARQRVAEAFSIDTMVQRHVQLFEELLSNTTST